MASSLLEDFVASLLGDEGKDTLLSMVSAILVVFTGIELSMLALSIVIFVVVALYTLVHKFSTSSRKLKVVLLGGLVYAGGDRIYEALSSNHPKFVGNVDRVVETCRSTVMETFSPPRRTEVEFVVNGLDRVLDGCQSKIREFADYAGPRLYQTIPSRSEFVDGLDSVLDGCQSKLREFVVSTESGRDDAFLDTIDTILDGFQAMLHKELLSRTNTPENAANPP